MWWLFFTPFPTSNGSKSSPLKLTNTFIPVCKADMSLSKWSVHPTFNQKFFIYSVKLKNIRERRGVYSIQYISPVFDTRKSCLWFLGLYRTLVMPRVRYLLWVLIVYWAVYRQTLLVWREVIVAAISSVSLL